MANDDETPARVLGWEDTLAPGDIRVLGVIFADFDGNGGALVAVSMTAYAARIGMTATGVEQRIARLESKGAIHVAERVRGAMIVRPIARPPASDFARAASRLRPSRSIRHRSRPVRPAAPAA